MYITDLAKNERYFRIKNNHNKFFYRFFPSNNKNQSLCHSKEYASKDESIQEIEKMINFLIDKKINNDNSDFVEIEEINENDKQLYRYVFKNKHGERVLFGEKRIHKKDAKNGISSLYNQIYKLLLK